MVKSCLSEILLNPISRVQKECGTCPGFTFTHELMEFFVARKDGDKSCSGKHY